MKEKAKASYLKKGQDIVDMNYKAIDLGATAYKKIDVPADWANAVDTKPAKELKGKPELVKMVKDILEPVGKMDGDSLPVSAFVDHVDGQFELGAPPMRSAAWPSPSPPGTPRSASSATSAPMSAPTPPSVPSL